MLALPFITQLGLGYNNLCGSANVAMLVRGYTDKTVTPVQIATRLGVLNQFTTMAQMVAGATLYGVAVETSTVADWSWVKAKLDSNRPVVCLVDYRKYSDNPNRYEYAHFLTVLGYTDTHVIVNDPLRYSGGTQIPLSEFIASISSRSLVNKQGNVTNNPFQAVVPLQALRSSTLTGAGINLDPRNPHGKPSADKLQGYSFARIEYNISDGKGTQDVGSAEAVYRPYLEALPKDCTPVIVFTHRTYGEEVKDSNGNNAYNWEWMNYQKDGNNIDAKVLAWSTFRANFIRKITEVARLYVGRGIVYQIMNEQDSEDSRASVVIPPKEYGLIFNEAYTALKVVDANCTVITGGYNSGATRGSAQFKAASIKMCDGVALHPYGASAGGIYDQPPIPSIDKQLAEWRKATSAPLWVTEFGFVNVTNAAESLMSRYVRAFVDACTAVPNVKPPMWYAYSDYMDNCYGVEDRQGNTRSLLQAELVKSINAPVKPAGYPVGQYTLETTQLYINIRATPNGVDIGDVKHGDRVTVNAVPVSDFIGGFYWQSVSWNGVTGWLALMPSYTLKPYSANDDNTEAVIKQVEIVEKALTEIKRLLNGI